MNLQGQYHHEGFDELFGASARPEYLFEKMSRTLFSLGEAELRRRQSAVESEIRSLGISFTVYDNNANVDRQWPMDVIPRAIRSQKWAQVARGLEQRLTTLNLFIDDLYNKQMVVKDGVFPAQLLESSRYFLKQCVGMKPKFGIWAHICGTDLIRNETGEVFVLEDNLRVPSGVSYMLENRQLTKRAFPELFSNNHVQPVDGYLSRLLDLLVSLAPDHVLEPNIALLTPGVHNSAYFEHCYLAQQMGIELVEGQDLFVDDDDCVYMKTIGGKLRLHVLYRRVSDEFLDPEATNPDSLLGCRGLFRAWRKKRVALVNAPGAGVADDKLVYSYVPELTRYYLDQDPILPSVKTYRLFEDAERKKVLENLDRYVVKPVNESGGYGVIVGDRASQDDLENCRVNIRRDPRNFVAQPIIQLSTAPTLCHEGIEPRHLDLRPFILSGASNYVTRGGLTRVALQKGSLVVNSSQGGGSKDTWIVED